MNLHLPDREFSSPRDRLIGALADRQNRVISTAQLKGLRVSDGSIQKRVEAGSLVRVMRGIYLVGVPTLDWDALKRTALLVTGPESRLDTLTAAQLRGMLPVNPRVVTVSRPARGRPKTLKTELLAPDGKPALIVVRGRAVLPHEVESVDGFRSTAIPRTFIDLASEYRGQFLRAWREGQYQNLIDWDAMRSAVEATRRPGSALVAAKVQAHLGTARGEVRSPAEYEFVQMLLRAGVPEPLVNHAFLVAGEIRRPDLYFPFARLIVEVDSWSAHRSRESFEDDPARDNDFLELGILTMRFTAHYAQRHPRRCADLVLQQTALRSSAVAPWNGVTSSAPTELKT